MMGSKSKKRVVLPSRPEPPTVEQMVEDMSRAEPQDPLFSILEPGTERGGPIPPPDASAAQFQQVRRLLELGERLRESGGKLRLQREELESVSHKLQHDITQVKSQTQI